MDQDPASWRTMSIDAPQQTDPSVARSSITATNANYPNFYPTTSDPQSTFHPYVTQQRPLPAFTPQVIGAHGSDTIPDTNVDGLNTYAASDENHELRASNTNTIPSHASLAGIGDSNLYQTNHTQPQGYPHAAPKGHHTSQSSQTLFQANGSPTTNTTVHASATNVQPLTQRKPFNRSESNARAGRASAEKPKTQGATNEEGMTAFEHVKDYRGIQCLTCHHKFDRPDRLRNHKKTSAMRLLHESPFQQCILCKAIICRSSTTDKHKCEHTRARPGLKVQTVLIDVWDGPVPLLQPEAPRSAKSRARLAKEAARVKNRTQTSLTLSESNAGSDATLPTSSPQTVGTSQLPQTGNHHYMPSLAQAACPQPAVQTDFSPQPGPANDSVSALHTSNDLSPEQPQGYSHTVVALIDQQSHERSYHSRPQTSSAEMPTRVPVRWNSIHDKLDDEAYNRAVIFLDHHYGHQARATGLVHNFGAVLRPDGSASFLTDWGWTPVYPDFTQPAKRMVGESSTTAMPSQVVPTGSPGGQGYFSASLPDSANPLYAPSAEQGILEESAIEENFSDYLPELMNDDGPEASSPIMPSTPTNFQDLSFNHQSVGIGVEACEYCDGGACFVHNCSCFLSKELCAAHMDAYFGPV